MSSFDQSIVDISQMNMEELIRDIEEKEVVKILKIIMENNTKILELQKTLVILIKREDENTMRDGKKKNRKKERRKKKRKREKGQMINGEEQKK